MTESVDAIRKSRAGGPKYFLSDAMADNARGVLGTLPDETPLSDLLYKVAPSTAAQHYIRRLQETQAQVPQPWRNLLDEMTPQDRALVRKAFSTADRNGYKNLGDIRTTELDFMVHPHKGRREQIPQRPLHILTATFLKRAAESLESEKS